MENIILNINKKITTLIDKKAFEDIVSSLSQTIEGIKINSSKTEVLIQDNSKVTYNLELKVKKGEKIREKINEIKSKIEFHTLYLIDSKPKNIIINFVGQY